MRGDGQGRALGRSLVVFKYADLGGKGPSSFRGTSLPDPDQRADQAVLSVMFM